MLHVVGPTHGTAADYPAFPPPEWSLMSTGQARPFLGRNQEVDLLNRELDRSRSSLMVLCGRRRVGKSALLAHVTRTRRTIHYQATDVLGSINLALIKGEIARHLGEADPILEALERTAKTTYGRGAADTNLVLLSRSGFTQELRRRAAGTPSLHLLDPKGLLGEGQVERILPAPREGSHTTEGPEDQ